MSGEPNEPGPLAKLAGGLAAAAPALARIGWELHFVDVDEVARRVDVRAHHVGGRWVHLRITDCGADLERWQRRSWLGRPEGAGRVPSTTQVEDFFMGRTRIASGPQGALRALAEYLADNTGASRTIARDALRPALAAYLTQTEDALALEAARRSRGPVYGHHRVGGGSFYPHGWIIRDPVLGVEPHETRCF